MSFEVIGVCGSTGIVRRTQRIFTTSRYDLAVLVLVVVDMVVKPGL